MTKRKTQASKSSMKSKPISMSAAMQKELKEHPEVLLVLEIAKRNEELQATQIPIDFEAGPTPITGTAITSQYPFAAA